MRKTFSALAFSHFHNQWRLSPGLDTGGYVFFSGVTGCRPLTGQSRVIPKVSSGTHSRSSRKRLRQAVWTGKMWWR